MKVGVFTDNDFDKVNGVTTTLRAVIEHAPAGLELRVYTAGPLGVDAAEYLSLASVGLPIPFYRELRMYLPRVLAYLHQARRAPLDVVHVTTPGPVGLAALYVAHRLRLPLVGSFHTDLAAYVSVLSGSARLGALMREYMRWFYGRCDRVLVPSEHTRHLLVASKVRASRVSIWGRGVDTALFSPERRSAARRDSWHVDERRPALVYVGRLSKEKGLDLLAPLQQRLHALGVQHQFVIVGQGPMQPDLRESLPGAVFTGVLSREALAPVLASADLFVFPSRTDTAGNVVLEAQASGVPVVVSTSGGPREQMRPNRTGLTCETSDPDEWAAAVAAIVKTPGKRADMAAAARTFALTRRWSRALEPLYDTYTEMVSARRNIVAGVSAPAVRA